MAESGDLRPSWRPFEPTLRPVEEVSRPDLDNPSIFLVSIPKSGTVYLNAALRVGLGLPNVMISNGYFPEDQLNLAALPGFMAGGQIAPAHIDPSPTNLQFLDAFVAKWIVHVRDPRSVVLSWIHHVARYHGSGQGDLLYRVTPVPPQSYHALPMSARVDWTIRYFLPCVVIWMTDWMRIADASPARILVTEYQELLEDETALIDRILDFIGIDRGRYRHVPPDKTMAAHFRTGTTDEWRQVFTPSQTEACGRLIPPALKARFGWPH